MSLLDTLKRILGSEREKSELNATTSQGSVTSQSEREIPRSKPEKKPIELTIGLDFGTAFTKVVIGEQRKSYAIPFQTPTNLANQFLLPCEFSIDADGACSLGVSENARRVIGNLKMRLIERDFSHESVIEIGIFLGLVIRHSRDWLLNNEQNVYRNRLPDWYINIGLPTDSYHDEELSKVYRDIAALAWRISVAQGPVTLELAKKLVDVSRIQDGARDVFGNHLEPSIHPDKIGLFPEFVAQIMGYVRSPSRQPDLHALVDIGAGTVDITVFNVYEKDGEHLFPIFAKEVKNLGVNYLFKHRIEESEFKGEWRLDTTSNAPDDLETASRLGIFLDILKEIDKAPRAELRTAFMSQLAYTRDVRHPKSAKWKDGVPLFLCGGGSRLSFYASLFNELAATGRRYPIVITPLPKPERLDAEGLAEDEYDRLSVAYGLSFSALDIGTIRTTDQVDDVLSPTGGELTMCYRCLGSGGPRGNDCLSCGGRGWIN